MYFAVHEMVLTDTPPMERKSTLQNRNTKLHHCKKLSLDTNHLSLSSVSLLTYHLPRNPSDLMANSPFPILSYQISLPSSPHSIFFLRIFSCTPKAQRKVYPFFPEQSYYIRLSKPLGTAPNGWRVTCSCVTYTSLDMFH